MTRATVGQLCTRSAPMPARAAWCWHIRSQQADYVPTVKNNQRTLRAALEETFAEERRVPCEACPYTAHCTVNGGHGHIEIRRGWALGDPEYLRYVALEGQWPDLRSLLLVEAERRVGN